MSIQGDIFFHFFVKWPAHIIIILAIILGLISSDIFEHYIYVSDSHFIMANFFIATGLWFVVLDVIYKEKNNLNYFSRDKATILWLPCFIMGLLIMGFGVFLYYFRYLQGPL